MIFEDRVENLTQYSKHNELVEGDETDEKLLKIEDIIICF
jgi:hypothetical protein